MNKLYVNISKALTAIIIIVGTFYTVWTIIKGDNLKADIELQKLILNPYFIFTLVVAVIATIGALVFPLIGVFSSFKSALRMILVLAIMAGIYGISWAFADGNIDANFYAEFNIDEWMSRFIGTLINIVYILGGLAILATLGSGIYGIFLKR